MFPTPQYASPFAVLTWARALQTWREAASLVSTRWQVFLEAEPERRRSAFASYLAALDAEEAAASDMAARLTPVAA
jgi:hypothetical protein